MLREHLYTWAGRLYPPLHRLPETERYAAAGYVWRAILFTVPSLIGIAWLIGVTDWNVFQEHWLFIVILFAFLLMFSTLWFETYYVTVSGSYRSERRSFWGEAMWSGVLVFGPTVAWLGVVMPLVAFFLQRREGTHTGLQAVRLFSQSIFRVSVLVPTLVEVAVYEQLGGRFPIPSLDTPSVWPAVAATLVGFTLGSLMIAMSQGISRIMAPVSASQRAESSRLFVFMTLLGPFAGLVAIIPAGMYSLAGAGGYFSFQAIILMGTFVVDRLSRTIESARRRTGELEQLQRLSQALLQSSPDEARLSNLLETFVPSMFPLCEIAIRLHPDQMLLILPKHWDGPGPGCWQWEPDRDSPLLLHPRDARPWLGHSGHEGIIVMPVVEPRTRRVLGRLVLQREHRISTFRHLMPAVQWLADQIATAHYNAETYRQTLSERVRRERLSQELTFARSVQTSFLPAEHPKIAGWQLAAVLEPALETSGDFFDLIPLHGGRLGIVIADVADKGLGAALYMALSRTLIRAYAIDYARRYAQTYLRQLAHMMQTVNARIVTDTHNDLFVTVFFGVLDPQSGVLTYVNAGHNPPLLFRRTRSRRPRALRRTGPPIGILETLRWTRRTVKIDAGETLVLYTDGLTEANNANGDFYGEEGLQATIQSCLQSPAEDICAEILRAVAAFEGGAPRADDITLLVLRREN
ncbi:MAG TPA: PP2C family protein-serine/threonine phosphatase [Aggregatilineales bacterium]|nr:PP2C family protein-serine/threonine phosphatase [Aggregatilineales bacterium]